MNRIEYIDQLKGLAIIFVVMGHVAELSMNITTTPFNYFKGSFHMPLFMFLSGIFAFKSFQKWNIAESLRFIIKKTLRILVPFFVIGGAYSVLFLSFFSDVYTGANSNFWFLPALFYCMFFALIVYLIVHRVKYLDNTFGVLLIQLIFWIISALLYYRGCLENIPFSLHAIKMYPFFVFGTLFSRYAVLRDKITHSNNLYTIAILGYVLCLMYQNKMVVQLNYSGVFAIIILINIFVKYNQYIPKQLSFIGKYSLEIYVFHWFLLPTLNKLGQWVSSQSIGFNENFIILFCITFIIAMPIIGICIILSKFIQNSRILDAVCFGSFK